MFLEQRSDATYGGRTPRCVEVAQFLVLVGAEIILLLEMREECCCDWIEDVGDGEDIMNTRRK